ncbi:MAG: glutamate racemase [Oscillospiraceae bacterium]|nr:glutamate racemase [Oscillospiraceae bacterium]
MQTDFNRDMKIGVTDSGVGGLTVVKELMRVLPNESIVYYGDNRNCPYGNKDKTTLLALAGGMIRTLNEHSRLKLAALACNTTSTFADDLRPSFEFPVISVIEPAVSATAKTNAESVGVLATCFTANSGCYDRMINNLLPKCRVTAVGSKNLAALIDTGNLDSDEIPEEISTCMSDFVKQDISQVILACTHYPIVQGIFEQMYPSIKFINPAEKQAEAVKEYLEKNDLCSSSKAPTFEIFTTGEAQIYIDMCSRLGIRQPDAIHTL